MRTLHVFRKVRLGASLLVATIVSVSSAGVAEAQTVTVEWTRQFGGALIDVGREVAVDADGNVYFTGDTDGLPGEPHAGGIDAFVRKYTAGGALIWSRQFGTTGDEIVGLNATGLAVGPDAVYVARFTSGSFPGYTNAGGLDAFLRKYDFAGGHVWTVQFGTDGFDDLHDVAVDRDKAIYVAGSTDRALPGQTWAGDFDAVLRKYNPDGTIAWTRQVGTSALDHPVGIAFGSTGVYLTGNTTGSWPGFTSAGGLDALVLRFTRDGDWNGRGSSVRRRTTSQRASPRTEAACTSSAE